MNGLNLALVGVAVLLVVLFARKKAMAAPAPSPSAPIDTGHVDISRLPGGFLASGGTFTLPGVTLQGTKTDPLTIRNVAIDHADIDNAKLGPGVTIQVSPDRDPVASSCAIGGNYRMGIGSGSVGSGGGWCNT
jgi:hypothetical protein